MKNRDSRRRMRRLRRKRGSARGLGLEGGRGGIERGRSSRSRGWSLRGRKGGLRGERRHGLEVRDDPLALLHGLLPHGGGNRKTARQGNGLSGGRGRRGRAGAGLVGRGGRGGLAEVLLARGGGQDDGGLLEAGLEGGLDGGERGLGDLRRNQHIKKK